MQDLVDVCHADIRKAIHNALESTVTVVTICKAALEGIEEQLNSTLLDATLKFDLAATVRLSAFRGELSKEVSPTLESGIVPLPDISKLPSESYRFDSTIVDGITRPTIVSNQRKHEPDTDKTAAE